jgi:uncharacterized glyoxalase superfamily protein PhnB
MSTFISHINNSGWRRGTEAIEFYKKIFGAEERFLMQGPDGKCVRESCEKCSRNVFERQPVL